MKRVVSWAALAALLFLGTDPAFAAAPAGARPDVDAQWAQQQVDALCAGWDRPGMPGAVVEVIRDGSIVASKAYGLADIERGVPMTTATEFTLGSMSKQFTAFSIYLLAQDGKLALDDDIRKYVPEVPDLGKTITLRHLLHHTSGLRDYLDLRFMAGWRPDEVVTDDDGMALVQRQRGLNFDPGQAHLYSNTGYLLLARVVQRVSGQPLADFAQARIFAPLGMTHTRYQHAYGNLIPGRALSYTGSAAVGFQYVAAGESADGAGGVVSTAGDLALWDRNFYDGRVGGKALIAQMQALGVLNDGKRIDYASGLVVGGYRGRLMVQHGGAIGGYRTLMARFPDQHFTVLVLANRADLDIWGTMFKLADVYLDHEAVALPAAGAAPRAFVEVPVDPARLDALVGYYALTPTVGIAFTKEDGRLMAQATGSPKLPAFAYGERAFFAKAIDAQFTFDPPDKDGVVAGGVLHQNGADRRARRAARPVLAAQARKQYEGEFYSDELHVLYTVASRDGLLVLTYPGGTVTLDGGPDGEFATGSLVGTIKYQCGAQGCNGFAATTGRVRNLQFVRVDLAAASQRGAAPAAVAVAGPGR